MKTLLLFIALLFNSNFIEPPPPPAVNVFDVPYVELPPNHPDECKGEFLGHGHLLRNQVRCTGVI